MAKSKAVATKPTRGKSASMRMLGRVRYRMSTLTDMRDRSTALIVQAKREQDARWTNCCEGTEPLIFRSRERVRRLLRWLNNPDEMRPDFLRELRTDAAEQPNV